MVMNNEGELFFSPQDRFRDIDFDNPPSILKAFANRVVGYYLQPADLLRTNGNAFACGLVCCAAIDLLSRCSLDLKKVDERITTWLSTHIPAFSSAKGESRPSQKSKRFYKDFRCGLVHEGRIKRLGQFSLESGEMVHCIGRVMVINPGMLLDAIKEAVERYIAELDSDPAKRERFVSRLRDDFVEEARLAHKAVASASPLRVP